MWIVLPQKLRDQSLASAVRHRYGIKNVSRGFSGLITAVGRPCRMGRREGWRSRARAGLCPQAFLCPCHPQAAGLPRSWLGDHLERSRTDPPGPVGAPGEAVQGQGAAMCCGVRAAPTPCHPLGATAIPIMNDSCGVQLLNSRHCTSPIRTAQKPQVSTDPAPQSFGLGSFPISVPVPAWGSWEQRSSAEGWCWKQKNWPKLLFHP